jgi:hypothetical protein
MPFAGFDDFDDCLDTMRTEEGHDEESARRICGALQAESKSEHGNVDQLREALSRGRGLIADVGVDLVSGVDVPAIDSAWVMRKSTDEGHDYRVDSQLVLAKADDDDGDEAARVAYAAAMIPREPDKEGDVVATPTVEKAAHGFLANDGGVDTDHSLIDGEGEVVESWVLKEDRAFDLPGGADREYGAGTWMVGIKWGKDAWERIQAGELTGLSIYGMAEQSDLAKAADTDCGCEHMTDETTTPTGRTDTSKDFAVPFADETVVHVVYESQTAAEKASEAMGLGGDIHDHTLDGMTVHMPGATHDEFVDAYLEYAESDDVGPVVDAYGEDGEKIEASAADATAKEEKEEDPCWEGYTMVGLDEQGNPRCVPDDDIDDVEFDSVTVRESPDQPAPDLASKGETNTGEGETPNTDDGEPSKHEAMTDDDLSLSAVAEKVDGLSEDVSAIKDALDSGGSTEKAAIDAIDDAVQTLAESEDINLASDEMRSMLIDAIQPADKENGMDGDEMDDEDDDEDEDDEDMEMSASEGETSKAADANLAKGHGGGAGTTADLETTGASGVPSYADLASNYGDN